MDDSFINKKFLNHIEELLMRSKPCLVVLKVENGGLSSIKGIITHFQAQPREEAYIKMDNGLFIGLEELDSIDGVRSNLLV
ncbi:MAG: hypothetical protein NVS1B13_22090 [Flavisolibacter sp.]